jgi:hypothetical protein
MRPDCIAAVQAAAKTMGRDKLLTDAQLAAIDDRLSATMRQLARTEEGWQGLSADARIAMAAERAMQDIQGEAARKVANAQLQIVKTAAVEARIADAQRVNGGGRSHALVHVIDLAQNYITGIKLEAMGNLMQLMDAVKSGDGASVGKRVSMFLFDGANPKMTGDLAAEIFGNADGSTGNKVAQLGAKAYLTVIEGMRQRFNAAGGDVGKLEYGYLPQPHDPARVRGKGDQAARDAWVQRIQPLLDRAQYVDEAGARLSDSDLTGVLNRAWETISTGGANKREPGAGGGSSARANKGSESRQIHFKDAQGYLDYMADYGRGSMYDAIIGHVGGMSRDIGLVEQFGPNPNSQIQAAARSRRSRGRRREAHVRPAPAELLGTR